MKTSKYYSLEIKERAIRLAQEQQPNYPSHWATIVSISSKIGCTAETLRSWIKNNELADNKQIQQDKLRLKQLEKENKELKEANDILD